MGPTQGRSHQGYGRIESIKPAYLSWRNHGGHPHPVGGGGLVPTCNCYGPKSKPDMADRAQVSTRGDGNRRSSDF
eukprot:scaffold25941_cov211-Cylindrotheca_fusiformis.AAC.1